MGRRWAVTLGAVALVFTFSGVASAVGIVAQHVGDTNPLTEGWYVGAQGGSYVQGPVTSPPEALPAWKVDDNGGYYCLQQNLTNPEREEASLNGWVLRTRLRVVDIPDTLGASVHVVYETTGNPYNYFSMRFGSDASGNALVDVGSGGTITVPGSGYHLYELVCDPADGLADFYVDGGLEASDLGYDRDRGFQYVQWGSNTSSDTGHGHYNLVEFEIVPEPTAVSLMALGAVALLRRRRG